MILDAIRESGGCAVAVPEGRIVDAMRRAIASEGISICPESAACVLAVEQLLASNRLDPGDRVVLFNSGSVSKYVESVPLDPPVIADPDRVDYDALGSRIR